MFWNDVKWVVVRNDCVSVLLQIQRPELRDKMFCLSREPFAVSFISPKVSALRQEDDGERDRAVSTETCSEYCVVSVFLFFTCMSSTFRYKGQGLSYTKSGI